MPRDRYRQSYETAAIEVTFEPKLCIHAARCVAGLPAVFRPDERRWIQLEHGDTDEIAEVVLRCPTGALAFHRLDGGPQEEPDPRTTVEPRPNGPLFVRGDIDVVDTEGNLSRHATRVAFCRCGGSENKPFCDGTHRRIGFRAP